MSFSTITLIQYLFLLFILIITAASTNTDQNSCKDLLSQISKSNSEIISYLKENIDHFTTNSQHCIDILIKNGKIDSLDFYLTELTKKGIKFRESLNMSVNTMKKTLEEIYNRHRFDENDYQVLFPAFQWAQSMDDVFLEIKFSHRHDTPGCLEMKEMNVDIKNNTVSFVGYCVLGDVPIKIDFFIKTWQKINIERSSHRFGSAGRYQINLKKNETGMYWDKLLSEDTPNPPNMRVWFEMKEKFEEQIKKYEEQDEEDEFKREVEEIEKKANEKAEKAQKRRRKNKRNSHTLKNNTVIEKEKNNSTKDDQQNSDL